MVQPNEHGLAGFKAMFEFAKDRLKSTLNAKVRFIDVVVAFQPIVDARQARVWGYEALTRGVDGQSYPQLSEGMSERRRVAFDKLATMRAMREAARLGLTRDGAKITLNVRPTMDRAAVDAAFVSRAAKHFRIPLDSIVLELTEDAKLSYEDFQKVVQVHHELGIATGIDDFGSGYSGLNVLATCGAAMVKLDRHLIHGIDRDRNKQMIVESFTNLCTRLGSMVVAEGVETQREAEVLLDQGIELMQGYYFGRPSVGTPSVLRLAVGDLEAVQASERPSTKWHLPVEARV
jgi:EAL domain-containing protein (putative c-di-GMP-specific phosphodiesterase class I)